MIDISMNKSPLGRTMFGSLFFSNRGQVAKSKITREFLVELHSGGMMRAMMNYPSPSAENCDQSFTRDHVD